jgi:hypothetical protein
MPVQLPGTRTALKCCRKDRIVELEQRKHILSERACMARLATPDNPHPFINTLIQTFRQRDKLFFLLDFVQVRRIACRCVSGGSACDLTTKWPWGGTGGRALHSAQEEGPLL